STSRTMNTSPRAPVRTPRTDKTNEPRDRTQSHHPRQWRRRRVGRVRRGLLRRLVVARLRARRCRPVGHAAQDAGLWTRSYIPGSKVKIMILKECFSLANGVTIPKLGLGTWRVDDGAAAQVVRDAIGVGYRHIDTAQAYGNERGVGEGVRASGIARDDIFVATKLAAECKSYREAKDRINASLKALGLDPIDLMLIHSPQPWSEFRQGGHYFEGNL